MACVVPTLHCLLETFKDERYHPPPAVLPREGVVVVALGSFKALVHTEACILFEAARQDVSHAAPILAKLMEDNVQVSRASGSPVPHTDTTLFTAAHNGTRDVRAEF